MARTNVFLSYAHQDRESVDNIFHALRTAKVPIWIDQEIRAGSDWMAEIESALSDAKVIVLCISPSFLASAWANVEIGIALSRARESNVRIIPLLLRDTIIPDSLKRFQFLDARRLPPEDVAKEIKKVAEAESEENT